MTRGIAVFSGPRNLSTALMRSFEARGDCAVSDEPLYAAYLAHTGLEHPMRDEVIASQPTDWRTVVDDLLAPRAEPLHYQKHMAHHLLPHVGRDWLREVDVVLLIRHPARVVSSYAKQRESVRPADLGYAQQVEILDFIEAGEGKVVIVDSTDIRADPASVLQTMCTALGIPWTPRMLGWAPGSRATDGVWGSHWYARVRESTGFAGEEGPVPPVDARLEAVVDAVMPAYVHLASHPGRIRR